MIRQDGIKVKGDAIDCIFRTTQVAEQNHQPQSHREKDGLDQRGAHVCGSVTNTEADVSQLAGGYLVVTKVGVAVEGGINWSWITCVALRTVAVRGVVSCFVVSRFWIGNVVKGYFKGTWVVTFEEILPDGDL
jgi:hypothetical protein